MIAQTNENLVKILSDLATRNKHAVDMFDFASAKRHATKSLEIIAAIEATWEQPQSSDACDMASKVGKPPNGGSLLRGVQVLRAQDCLPGEEGDDLVD